jgi:ribonuclease D
MHGADYDMTMLRREFDEIPPVVYDTQIGARLLGVRKFGLANLVEHYFDVVLSKTSQKADWGKRPLSPKMTEYALNDVRYLLEMGEKIVAELREKGRYDWFVESCDAARQKVLERDESKEEPWRVQGAGRLDRKGLNYLRALWMWRDSEAESWDRPSFMVATNRNLLEWSGALAAGKRVDFPGHFRADRRRRLDATLANAAKDSPDSFPEKMKGLRRRRDSDFEVRVNEMIAVRDKKAAELNIDSSLIASRGVIETLAIGEGDCEGLLLKWQKECLGLD